MQLDRYRVVYEQFNPAINNTVTFIETVVTRDIYHWIGKLICLSVHKISIVSCEKISEVM